MIAEIAGIILDRPFCNHMILFPFPFREQYKASSSYSVFIIDDDPLVIDTVALCLPPHWEILKGDPKSKATPPFFHAALVDVHLSGNLEVTEGIDFMDQIQRFVTLSYILGVGTTVIRIEAIVTMHRPTTTT